LDVRLASSPASGRTTINPQDALWDVLRPLETLNTYRPHTRIPPAPAPSAWRRGPP